jgi:nucleoside phosphorylase
MGRVGAANATNDAIHQWKPQVVLLVGIAGGMAEAGVSLGDVIVSDQIVDYELQKVKPEALEIRYSIQLPNPGLLNAAKNYLRKDWQKRIKIRRPLQGTPKRVVGPIATGDKVIAFGAVLQQYREAWPKLIGVEMEAGA